MGEFTPTTSTVRMLYARSGGTGPAHPSTGRRAAEFDRWLAQHDAEVARPLPDPTGPCACSFDSEDRGGGHFELVQEYEPACPVHSEHLYDPVLGMWVLRDQVSPTRPERPMAGVKAVQPGEGGFF